MGCDVFVDGASQKPDQTPPLEASHLEAPLHHPLGEHRSPFRLLLDAVNQSEPSQE